MIQNRAQFDALIADALAQPFSGWDFSYISDRWQQQPLPWDYRAIVQKCIGSAHALLDMGTGGGKWLSKLANLPDDTHATEAWPPNIEVARQRLKPRGIAVHRIEEEAALPFEDDRFDTIINRHEWYDPNEVYRILSTEGHFITQQVGDQNDLRLNQLISGEAPTYDAWSLDIATDALREAGFEILHAQEAYPNLYFHDIGAIVYFLKVVKWQIPDFSVERYNDQLGAIHNMILKDGALAVPQHRFWVMAHKP